MADARLGFGLRFHSDVALPELAPGGAGEADVVIRLGATPLQLANATRVKRHGWATPEAFLFEAPGVARYLVSGGAEVTVEPCPGANAARIRTFLLGSVLGALCYQRGLLPLHANALAAHGGAVALAGESGAGKSTLAAHLARRGFRAMGDDVCVLGSAPDGRVMVWPGARRFKLWADALGALDEGTGGLERVVAGRDKYILPYERHDAAAPAPFERLYRLAAAPPGRRGGIRQLDGTAAFEALIANAYRLEIAIAMGRRPAVFDQVIETLRQAPVFVFERRWGLEMLAEEAAVLEAHVAAPVGSSAYSGLAS